MVDDDEVCLFPVEVLNYSNQKAKCLEHTLLLLLLQAVNTRPGLLNDMQTRRQHLRVQGRHIIHTIPNYTSKPQVLCRNLLELFKGDALVGLVLRIKALEEGVEAVGGDYVDGGNDGEAKCMVFEVEETECKER